RPQALSRVLSRNDLETLALVSSTIEPFVSVNERTSSALAWPCSLICAPAIPLRGRQSNGGRVYYVPLPGGGGIPRSRESRCCAATCREKRSLAPRPWLSIAQ